MSLWDWRLGGTVTFLMLVLFGCVSTGEISDTGESHYTRTLAEQGDAGAQYNLGVMYEKGQGVPQDYIEAYKWYSLALKSAVRSGNNDFARSMSVNKFLLMFKMTPAQEAKAKKLVREWRPKKTR